MRTRKFSELREKMSPAAQQEVKDRAALIADNIRLTLALEVVRDALRPGQNAAGLYYLTPSVAKVVENALKGKDPK